MTNPRSLTPASQTVPAWGDLFTNTAALLVAQEPALLFFVEGTGQSNQTGTAYGVLQPPSHPPPSSPHHTETTCSKCAFPLSAAQPFQLANILAESKTLGNLLSCSLPGRQHFSSILSPSDTCLVGLSNLPRRSMVGLSNSEL